MVEGETKVKILMVKNTSYGVKSGKSVRQYKLEEEMVVKCSQEVANELIGMEVAIVYEPKPPKEIEI